VEDGALAPFEDFEGRKSVLTVETAGADALDHHTLAEAKRRPHQSSCETMEEEPATLKTAGIDHDATYAAVAYFAAKPGPAHWEAFKRISPQSLGTPDLRFMHGEESSPPEGSANAKGSAAEDRHAISR